MAGHQVNKLASIEYADLNGFAFGAVKWAYLIMPIEAATANQPTLKLGDVTRDKRIFNYRKVWDGLVTSETIRAAYSELCRCRNNTKQKISKILV